jgi:4-diphosphocytidyl-2-C-methyl-D-erythritol kinase
MASITIRAPAKVNLYLKVLGRRADGYHEIESIMLPISLYDRLVLEETPSGIRLWCNHPPLQAKGRNLAQAAAEAMLALATPRSGVSIRLYKHIPVAAGLGGGSSDAAAVLNGLVRLWGLDLDREQLLRTGEQLGADVPFFILGRPALARGKGEQLYPISFGPVWLVVVNPGFGIAAADAYAGLDRGLTKKESYTTMQLSLFKQFELAQAAEWLENDLEAPIVAQYPVIKEIKDSLLTKGALGALMSGSGPSVFGLFDSRQQAESACRQLRAEARRGWSVFLTHTLNQTY